MKRYLVFTYDQYYPNGGWNDYKGNAHTIEDAKKIVDETINVENWHIVDIDYNLIVDGNT